MQKRERTFADCKHCGEHKMVIGRGWCGACYSRFQRYGIPDFRPRKDRAVCNVDGCEKSVVSHGLCDNHRLRLARYGQLDTLRPADWGKKTKHPLYIYWSGLLRNNGLITSDRWKNDFWEFTRNVGDRPSLNHFIRPVDIQSPLGPDNWQWAEGLDKAQKLEVNRVKRFRSERNRVRASSRERDDMVLAAGGKCQICGSDDNGNDCAVTGSKRIKKLCIDHDHATGRLRGVLCMSCNSALGHFKDDVSRLENAIRYLTEAKASNQNSVPVG